MSGTIFGLGLSQQIDANGRPMAGCRLYVYDANTTTPATTYQDFGLTAGLELPFPIEADANGRIPQFWLADGSYRARLTDSSGVVQFDLPEVLALGASSGAGGGGGVDPNAIFQTGFPLFLEQTGTLSGFVRDNGRTIGSATSGASERANADCEALFLFYWNKYSNSICPVLTGRGGSAAADWAANKQITTIDKRGKCGVGLADMGNSDSGALDNVTFDVGNATTAGSMGGAALHTLVTDEIPSHYHTGTTGTESALHTHSFTAVRTLTSSFAAGGNPTGAAGATTGSTGTESALHTHSFTSNYTGGDVSHNNMQPFVLGTWYRKLVWLGALPMVGELAVKFDSHFLGAGLGFF